MVLIETVRNLDAFMRIAPFLDGNMRKAGDQSSSKLFCKKVIKNDPRTTYFVGRYHYLFSDAD